MHVGPLSLGGLHALISSAPTRAVLSPPDDGVDRRGLRRQPFLRPRGGLRDRGRAAPSRGCRATLAEFMRQRIGRSGNGQTQDLLLAAACAATPTVDLIARVTGNTVERVAELLAAARGKGIIDLDEDAHSVRPPLVGAKRVHLREASQRPLNPPVVVGDGDAAQSCGSGTWLSVASSADPTTLRALDAAADAAAGRGGPAAAAKR